MTRALSCASIELGNPWTSLRLRVPVVKPLLLVTVFVLTLARSLPFSFYCKKTKIDCGHWLSLLAFLLLVTVLTNVEAKKIAVVS